MPPVGMLAPLFDVFLVMGAEVFTILRAEMIVRPPLIVVIAIVRSPFLILRPATIIPGAVLRDTGARENRQSGSQHDSM